MTPHHNASPLRGQKQELNDLLNAYDMKRDLVEVNYKASQWTHGAVWNRRYMEPRRGYRMSQLWQNRKQTLP